MHVQNSGSNLHGLGEANDWMYNSYYTDPATGVMYDSFASYTATMQRQQADQASAIAAAAARASAGAIIAAQTAAAAVPPPASTMPLPVNVYGGTDPKAGNNADDFNTAAAIKRAADLAAADAANTRAVNAAQAATSYAQAQASAAIAAAQAAVDAANRRASAATTASEAAAAAAALRDAQLHQSAVTAQVASVGLDTNLGDPYGTAGGGSFNVPPGAQSFGAPLVAGVSNRALMIGAAIFGAVLLARR